MISVAVAAYNGERFIEQQLESIYDQTERVDEVVICDDCSTDRTAEICREFIRLRSLSNWKLYVNEKNVGFCLNFYGAISKCCGDIIFLADQDDRWHIDKVERMTACLEAHPEIVVLSSRYDVIDSEGSVIENSGVKYLGKIFDGSVEYITPESLIGCSYIRGFSLCLRKSVKELIKPVDLKSLLAHDWLICMIGCLTGKTAFLNTKLTDYRYHTDNVSLSDMTRSHLIGDPQKRVRGLRESVEGHEYVITLMKDCTLERKTARFIRFEKRRLKFLIGKNPFLWLLLAFNRESYSRYYKGGGARVWLGDFAYAYRLDFRVRK